MPWIAAATLATGAMAYNSAQDANEFNAGQTAAQRHWQTNQNQLSRRFNRREAFKSRRFNKKEAKRSRTFSANQARISRAHDRFMSGTAVRRQMNDMRKAGINPILAGNYGGAPAPSGAMAHSAQAQSSAASSGMSGSSPIIPMVNPMESAVSTATDVMNSMSQADLRNAQKALADVDSLLKKQLIPGAEAISIVTNKFKELALAVEDVMSDRGYDAESLIDALTSKFDGLFNKLEQVGGTVEDLKNLASGLSGDAREIIINVINDVSGSLEKNPPLMREFGTGHSVPGKY